MYIDYYLKFDSEAEAKAVLYRWEYPAPSPWSAEDADAGEAEGRQKIEVPREPYQVAKYLAIDLIGTIYKPTGKMLKSDEGDVPEMTPLNGYHVNVRLLNDAPELEPYRVFPENPVRGWA
jgi:hypothetical protein